MFNLYRHTDVEENSQNVPRNSEILHLGSVYSTDLLVIIFDLVLGAGGRKFHFALQTYCNSLSLMDVRHLAVTSFILADCVMITRKIIS